MESSIAQRIRFSNFLPAQAVLAGNERRRDTRAGVLANLVGQNRTEQSAVSGGLDFRMRVQANVSLFVKDENDISILFPGTGLTVSTVIVNTQSMAAFMWRERVFEESEQIG